jgi:DNA-cytosine methyltransferase
MNTLSCFDGMSCAQIAMQQAGWPITKYFASEIDQHAIKVTQKNFPNTIQLGDICNVRVRDLGVILDFVTGGSPCQGFSRAGKGLNFDDPRSKLFFEYVRVVNEAKELNPDLIFLLENVDMKPEWQDIITEALGVKPIKINSTLVSAQNRVRLYWTNINAQSDMFGALLCGITQPKDRGLVLRDVLQRPEEVDQKYFLSEKALARIKRHIYSSPKVNPDKTGTLNTKNNSGQLSVDSGTTLVTEGVIVHSGYPRTGGKKVGGTGHLSRKDGKTYCIQPFRDANQLEIISGVINHGSFKGPDNHGQRTVIQINPSLESGGVQPYQQNRIYDEEGKSPAILAELAGRQNIIQRGRGKNNGNTHEDKSPTVTSSRFEQNHTVSGIRRLTPIECERLQGVPDNYTDCVSDTQRYKMLGNGWQVDTIVHILNHKS